MICRSQLFAILLATKQADVMCSLLMPGISITFYAYLPLAIPCHRSLKSESNSLLAVNPTVGVGESSCVVDLSLTELNLADIFEGWLAVDDVIYTYPRSPFKAGRSGEGVVRGGRRQGCSSRKWMTLSHITRHHMSFGNLVRCLKHHLVCVRQWLGGCETL